MIDPREDPTLEPVLGKGGEITGWRKKVLTAEEWEAYARRKVQDRAESIQNLLDKFPQENSDVD